MNFCKIHSLGNDFCVFGSPSEYRTPNVEFIKRVCDRHYGIGADCAIFITASAGSDYFMHVYNPDGREAEICGNALKCSARYVVDSGFFKRRAFNVETLSGVRRVTVDGEEITAEIGTPTVKERGTLEVSGVHFPFVSVDLGNPHCVVFVNGLRDDEFKFFGEEIEHHEKFKDGTNVEFASVREGDKILMRVWERGIGETLSCVTGSAACVAAILDSEDASNKYSVLQSGGTIDIEVRENGKMFTTGKCEAVFKGTLLR